MRRTLNLNLSVELCDNDNLTMTVRESPGSLCEEGETVDEEDTIVYHATLQYSPGVGCPLESVEAFIAETLDRWLDSASESIALEHEKWAKTSKTVKAAFQKQAGPEWACPNCGVVNCGSVCEDCGNPSPYTYAPKGEAS